MSGATRSAVPTPIVLVLIGIVSVQLGASIAKSLFDEASPTTLVWLRLLTTAVVVGVLARPTLRRRSRGDWLTVLAFGACLGLMNFAIYQSFARIPLGLAVTLEFIGPLTLALVMSRRARDLIWVALAACGVVLLGFERADLDPVGVAYALLAGAMWAAYILISAQTGRRWQGIDGLAVASTIAAGLLVPLLLAGDTTGLTDQRVLLLGVAVGVLSSVVPYSLELVALRSLEPKVFSILMSLEPAVAAMAGIVVLSEHLGVTQWSAIGCIVAASIGATRNLSTSRSQQTRQSEQDGSPRILPTDLRPG